MRSIHTRLKTWHEDVDSGPSGLGNHLTAVTSRAQIIENEVEAVSRVQTKSLIVQMFVYVLITWHKY